MKNLFPRCICQSLLALLSLPLLAQVASPDREMLTSYSWTDGHEFVKYVSEDTPEIMGIPNPTSQHPDWLFFVGGSLHEGGTNVCLQAEPGNVRVAEPEGDPYQWFPAGDQVETMDGCLIFRDGGNGALHGVLQPLTAGETLESVIRKDMLTFGLAGTYRDEKGRIYTFSAQECRAEGFSSPHFDFGYIFETPVMVVIFDNDTYQVSKSRQGLLLTPVEKGEYSYFPVKSGKSQWIQRVTFPEEYDFPLLSQKLLTIAEIRLYAGASSLSAPTTEKSRYHEEILETLATMRNEIFARHGYAFTSSKWRGHFGQKSWYHPTATEADITLSEIERINVEHLRLLEKYYKSELKRGYP